MSNNNTPNFIDGIKAALRGPVIAVDTMLKHWQSSYSKDMKAHTTVAPLPPLPKEKDMEKVFITNTVSKPKAAEQSLDLAHGDKLERTKEVPAQLLSADANRLRNFGNALTRQAPDQSVTIENPHNKGKARISA